MPRGLQHLLRETHAAERPADWFEVLEQRILLSAAAPEATVSAPSEAMVGEDFQFSIDFENTGADPGYAPFVDLILPVTGADGDDGIDLVGATFLGAAVETFEVAFDPAGEALHPLAVDATGAPLLVNGTPGDKLVVFRLPFGSFVSEQPTATIDVTASLSNLADVGTPLALQARGGFALGCDPLDNPGADPSMLQAAFSTAAVTPTVFEIDKAVLPNEVETATGPNYPFQYQIRVDIADGQTITDLDITDLFPADLAFLAVDSIVGAPATIVSTPIVGVPHDNANDPDLLINIPTITGTASGSDLVVTLSAFVPELDAAGNPFLDPTSGDDGTRSNAASAQGDWTPVDPRDVAAPVTDSVANVALDARSIAIQKGNSLFQDVGAPGLSPGDVVRFTLDVQVSDFFTFGDLVVTDMLSDGLRIETAGPLAPLFSATDRDGSVASVAFPLGDLTVTGGTPATPVQTLEFDLSSAIAAQPGLDGTMQGGLATGAPNLGATTAQIAYFARVQNVFDGPVPGNPNVGQGDVLRNDAVVAASVRDNAAIATSIGAETDDTASALAIATGTVSKEIYAVNGVIGAPTTVAPGDTVTFRIRYAQPLSDLENFRIDDYLPLPVFDATTVTVFDPTVGAVPPPSGTARHGPTDTFSALPGAPTPTLSSNAAANSLTFTYGDFDTNQNVQTEIDLLFTVAIEDESFADGLFLTNQTQAFEGNTSLAASDTTAIVQFEYTQPELEITKGVVAASNPSALFSPLPVGPVAFNTPGTPGSRFVGTIQSTSLGASPIDSDLRDVDAGDLVTFAIVVENTGSGRDGAFDVRLSDTLPAGFVIPGAGPGLNLRVADGTGAVLAFTDLGGGLFGTGIEIDDPGATGTPPGAIDPDDPTSGRNVVIVTYDLELLSSVAPGDVLLNTATVDSFAGLEGGNNRALNLADPASVTVLEPTVDKAVVATSRGDTGAGEYAPGIEDLAIGESVTFELTLTLPEGTNDLELTDQLPTLPGVGQLDLISSQVVAIGANVAGVVVGQAPTSTTANSVFYDFGVVTNTADNTADAGDQIVVEVVAILPDLAGNVAQDVLTNTGTLDFANGTVSGTAQVEVVEPLLRIDKTPVPASGDSGDTVTYSLVIQHEANSSLDAHDVVIQDALADPRITLVAGSVTTTAGSIVMGNGGGDTSIQVDVATVPLGGSVTVSYDAVLGATAAAGAMIPNTGQLDWDNTPGAPPPGTPERAASASDTAQVTVPSPSLDKSVASTSRAETGAAEHTAGVEDLTIGEAVTFDLTVTLPEGTTPVILTDQLPASPGAVLDIESASVSFVGGQITSGVTLGQALALSDTDGDGFDDRASLDFGNVVNAADGVADADDTFVVSVVARLVDDADNSNGAVIPDTATLDFGLGTVADSESVEVVEPELELTKSAGPTTGDAGDTITYSLTVAHTPGSTLDAFDLVVTDTLADAGVALVPGSVTTTLGVVTTGNAGGDTTIRVDVATLSLGQSVTITYQGQLTQAVAAGTSVPNTAAVGWDNTPGAPAPGVPERAGSDDDSASVAIPQPGFDKAVAASSNAETGAAQGDPALTDLTVGESVTFELTVTLPEGTTPVVVTDQLPVSPGAVLDIQSASVSFVGSRITSGVSLGQALTVSDSDGDGFDDRATLDFGNVVNTADGVADANDSFVVSVVATVVDDSDNTSGAVVSNTATLDFGAGTQSDSESVEIVEPVLLVDKSVNPTSASAGEILTYTVVASHDPGSTGPAFEVRIEDLLADPDLTLIDGSVTTSLGTVTTGNGAGDATVQVDVPVVDLGQSVTVTYQATLEATALAGTPQPNTADLAWTSNPGGGGRPGSGSDTEQVVVDTPGVDKSIVATSIPQTGAGQGDPAIPDLAIGELVTFDLTVTLVEATQPVLIADQLPTGPGILSLQSASVVFIGAGLVDAGSGLPVAPAVPTLSDTNADTLDDRAEWDFGTVRNAPDGMLDANDTIVVRVTALVEDVPGNTAGLQTDNLLDFGAGTDTDTETVEIVEPLVEIDKTGAIGANGVVTYTLTLTHAPGSTSAAFDLAVTDLLADPNLALIPGTVTASIGSVTTGNGAGDTTLRVDIPVFDLPDAPIVITFQGQTSGASPVDLAIPNTAQAGWDSAPGPGGRSGTDGDPETLIVAEPSLDKSIVATSVADTTDSQLTPGVEDLAVGETVTFDIVATFAEGATQAVVTDQLPTAPGVLQVVSAQVVSIGAGLSLAGGPVTMVGDTGVASDTNADALDDRLVFDLGTVTNASADATVTPDDQLVIRVVAEVADVADNAAGDLLTNLATLSYNSGKGSGSLADSESVEIVEPDLVVSKTASKPIVLPGGLVTYTVTLTHSPSSTAAAFDVAVSDLLSSPSLKLVAGSVTTSAGVVTSGNGAGETDVQVDVASLALEPVPETVTITYQARVAPGAPAGAAIPNTANAAFDGVPGPGGRSVGASDGAEVSPPPPPPRPPAPPQLSVFDLFSFNGFQNFAESNDGRIEERQLPERSPEPRVPPLSSLDPLYSGAGEPGGAVTLALTDRHGAPIGFRTELVDAGGNWVVNLPGASLDLEADGWFRVFDRGGLLAGGDRLLDGAQDRSDAREATVIGTLLYDEPHAVVVSETRPSFHATAESGQNNRTTFTPPLNRGHYVTHPPTPAGALEGRADHSVRLEYRAARSPLQGGWNKFTDEFLASSSTPSGRSR